MRINICPGLKLAHNCKKTNWLGEFLWRYERTNEEQRGHDLSVKPATKAEAARLDKAFDSYLANFPGGTVPPKLKELRDLPKYPAVKMRVHDKGSKVRFRDYIVRRPFFGVDTPFGRATRAYIAWDIEDEALGFLKDVWRVDEDGVLSEEQVYANLIDTLELPHMPEVIMSGDVRPRVGKMQSTLTQDYVGKKYSWPLPTTWIRRHVHSRIVQKLALPIILVRRSKQLTQAIRNVQGRKGKMIDFIFGVSHTQHWHSLNLQEHRDHYSALGALGSGAVSAVQDKWGAGVYFNTHVTVDGILIKYGVVNIDTLCRDLSEWDTLYLAGRLHKPVKILRDDPRVRLANQINLLSALRTALLLLPPTFTEQELYATIAGISYLGDPRMVLPLRILKRFPISSLTIC